MYSLFTSFVASAWDINDKKYYKRPSNSLHDWYDTLSKTLCKPINLLPNPYEIAQNQDMTSRSKNACLVWHKTPWLEQKIAMEASGRFKFSLCNSEYWVTPSSLQNMKEIDVISIKLLMISYEIVGKFRSFYFWKIRYEAWHRLLQGQKKKLKMQSF